MRRTLASLLLAVISFPLIGPVLLADIVSDLPACCRRNGAHHCAMSDSASEMPAGPLVKAEPKCPMFPRAVFTASDSQIVLHVAKFVGPSRIFRAALVQPERRLPQIAFTGSIRKRGPPVVL